MIALRSALLLAAVATCAVGCGEPAKPREFHVGPHAIRVSIPAGWESLDQGRQVLVRKSPAQVLIEDLGPAQPLGLRHELERARELWRAQRSEDARWRMRNLPLAPELFATRAEASAFRKAWYAVSEAPKDALYADVEPDFDEIAASIEAMPQRDVDTIASATLAAHDRDQRRDVKARRRASIDGRDAVLVETWSRLTHDQPQRFAFIPNDGYLLTLRTDLGPYDETSKAFESLLATLQFGAEPASGLRR